jgi:hypothetical protein
MEAHRARSDPKYRRIPAPSQRLVADGQNPGTLRVAEVVPHLDLPVRGLFRRRASGKPKGPIWGGPWPRPEEQHLEFRLELNAQKRGKRGCFFGGLGGPGVAAASQRGVSGAGAPQGEAGGL